MATTQGVSKKNINWKKILNIAQKGLGIAAQVVSKVAGTLADSNANEQANIVSYGLTRIPPQAFPTIQEVPDVDESNKTLYDIYASTRERMKQVELV